MDDFRPMIAITFDDGDRSLIETAYPAMRAAGMVGTSYVATGLTSGQFMSLKDQASMTGWELGTHSVSHNHMTKLTEAEQWAEIMLPIEQIERLTGTRPQSFACPYGDCDGRLIGKVKMVQRTHICVGGPALGVNSLAMWDRYHVSRFCPIIDTPLSRVTDMVDHLVTTQFMALCFHRIDDSGDQWSWPVDEFKRLVDHIATSNCAVVTMSEGADRMDWMRRETRGYSEMGKAA